MTKITAVTIIGCGDIGTKVAALWQTRGTTVSALCRSRPSLERADKLGIEPLPGDLDQPESLAHLQVSGRLVYYFAPPPQTGYTDPRMRALLQALPPDARPNVMVYISTTGVYGDSAGRWVNEDTPVNPQTARARRRLDAETALRTWGQQRGVPIVILRVPGIYGPGRLPAAAIRSRRPVVKESECGFTNRIHADDLARICVAAGDCRHAETIYNVSDGQPGTMTEYFNLAADALGLPRPPVVSRQEAGRFLSPEMLSYIDESRRIDSRRLRDELGVTLLYPSLQEGLAACATDPSARCRD